MALLASLLARLFARPVVGIVIATIVMLDPQVLAGAFTPTYELADDVRVDRRAVAGRRPAALAGLHTGQPRCGRHGGRPDPHGLPPGMAGRCCSWSSWWTVRRSVDTRTIVLTVAMPLVLVGGWMVKNEAMFDRPTLSSWFGMNLQRAVVPIATDDQLATWAANGDISEITAAYPSGFVSYNAYEPYIGECVPQR